MKKILMSLLLVLIMVVGSGVSAFADTSMETGQFGDVTVQTIDEDDIPEGVGIFPYEFSSDEEALAFVNKSTNMLESQLQNKETFVIKKDASVKGISWRFVTDYKPLTLWINDPDTGEPIHAVSKFNVYADLKINWGSTAGILMDYRDEGVSLTGLTLGLDISKERCTVDFTSNTRAKLTGRANLDYYLLVDGLIKLYSEPISYSWTYKTSR